MQTESFDLAGPAGRLEAVLMRPEAAPVAAAVVCHAHPLHGGMMHFKVVFRAAKALQHQGLAALRFNFRGVGRSEGVHDHGRGEQDDVRAALREVEQRFPRLPLLLGGFSFGSSMALRVGAADERVKAVFALGFPASMAGAGGEGNLTSGTAPLSLEGWRKPILFVHGERDEIGPVERIREMVEGLPEPRRLVVIGEADHFFAGRLEALQEAVGAWAALRPWEAR
ncbi:MAG TPA: alpha/beta fold hydrolase [Vicinamibacteria bacterium]|nr:alpha/beta fold hydrolase [Vicinamibacteria bacterium]